MTKRLEVMMQIKPLLIGGLVMLVALAGVLAQAGPAHAIAETAECTRIWAVMGGAEGSTDIQYVELRMSGSNQRFTNGIQLHFFDASGVETSTLTLDKNVDNGSFGASILIGTPHFDAAWTAGSVDFIMAPDLIAPAGKVAYGPAAGTNCVGEAKYYDSAAYGGAATGASDYGPAAPENLPTSGNQALGMSVLNSDQSTNDIDYSLLSNPTPRNNAGDQGPVDPSADLDADTISNTEDNCPDDPNPLQENTDADLGTAIPPAAFDGVPIGDSDGDECDDDDDDDGYSDTVEGGIGTTAVDNCTNDGGPGPNTDAWPSDMNMNDSVAINDVTGPFAPHFGAIQGVDPTGTNPGDYNPRVDLNQDGVIAINDITGPFAPDFGKSCT